MSTIIEIVTGQLGQWAIGAVAAILAVLGLWTGGKRSGRREKENELLRDTQRRTEAGREAVRAGRASGDDPDERVHENDDRWRGGL